MPATATRKTKKKSSVTSSIKDRDALVMSHMRLARHAVDKIAASLPKHVDRDDLLESAMLGLIDAASRFDPGRNVQFSTYAMLRIRGAIFDALRGADWLPRSLRSEIDALDKARNEIVHENHRPATETELTKRLGIGNKKLTKLNRASRTANFVSLNALQDDATGRSYDPTYPTHSVNEMPETRAILAEDKELLANAIAELTERERLVISMYYFDQSLLRDIAKILNVIDSRVCQIHRNALKRLQKKMTQPRAVKELMASAC